ncbi:MAG TPA: hypothetical protein VFS65_00695, partial [Candidatus Saccharimonadales bacterium]|nr:hypothetical protein [Candidatus Saccharimonadales bacterium]
PILAPALTGLIVTPAFRGNLLKWDALDDPILFGAEVWASQTNDRATASKIATVYDNSFMHLTEAGETWYYWIRSVSTYGRSDGPWLPVSGTTGIESTSLLTNTEDITPNAVTDIVVAQEFSAKVQTTYNLWESVLFFSFFGTGSEFLIHGQHLANLSIATLGTSQSAFAQQRMRLLENTIHAVGTVNLTNGSAVVTGIGTNWLTSLAVGQIFFLTSLVRYSIVSVDSDTQITLAVPYTGATASGEPYCVITATVSVFSLAQTTDKYAIVGAHCLSHSHPFNYRICITSAYGKMYDCILEWALVRDNTSWSINNSSIIRTFILEEMKR